MAALIALLVVALVVLIVLVRTIRIVPQSKAGIVERLGRYSRTLDAGLAIVIPFVDRLRPLIDMREQVVSFPPQPVITEDNLVVSIDSVIYFQVTEPKAATYEIADYIQAIEQLTVTTLRNVIGGISLEDTLTSRDHINAQLRGVLDEATGKWGIRVNRVELKAIDPPGTIQEAMEKQMRADRDRRAAILTAEGVKQSQILTAEGEKQSAILRAEGRKEAQVLEAAGQAQAIETVFQAIHEGRADPQLLAYQYLQVLPQIAQGDANKLWIIPSEFSEALGNVGRMLSARATGHRSEPGHALTQSRAGALAEGRGAGCRRATRPSPGPRGRSPRPRSAPPGSPPRRISRTSRRRTRARSTARTGGRPRSRCPCRRSSRRRPRSAKARPRARWPNSVEDERANFVALVLQARLEGGNLARCPSGVLAPRPGSPARYGVCSVVDRSRTARIIEPRSSPLAVEMSEAESRIAPGLGAARARIAAAERSVRRRHDSRYEVGLTAPS